MPLSEEMKDKIESGFRDLFGETQTVTVTVHGQHDNIPEGDPSDGLTTEEIPVRFIHISQWERETARGYDGKTADIVYSYPMEDAVAHRFVGRMAGSGTVADSTFHGPTDKDSGKSISIDYATSQEVNIPFTVTEPSVFGFDIMISRGDGTATNRLILELYRNRTTLKHGTIFRGNLTSKIPFSIHEDWPILESGKIQFPDGTIYARSDHPEYQGNDTIPWPTEIPAGTKYFGPLNVVDDVVLTRGNIVWNKLVHNTMIPSGPGENWMHFDTRVSGLRPNEQLVLLCKDWAYYDPRSWGQQYYSTYHADVSYPELTEIYASLPRYVAGWSSIISAWHNIDTELTPVGSEAELTTDPNAPYTIFLVDSMHFKLGIPLAAGDSVTWLAEAVAIPGWKSFGNNPGVLLAHRNVGGEYLFGHYNSVYRSSYGVINESTFRIDVFAMNKELGLSPGREKFIPAERIISAIINKLRKAIMLGFRALDGASARNTRDTRFNRVWMKNDFMTSKAIEIDFIHPEIWFTTYKTVKTISIEGITEA